MTPNVPTNETRDPHRHPEGQPDLQKDGQRDQDQGQPEQAVLYEQSKPVLEDVGVVVPDLERDARRERGNHLLIEVPLDGVHDLESLLVGGSEDLDIGGGLSSVAADEVHLAEAVTHFGDVAQPHHGSVGPADDDDLLEVLLRIVLTGGAYSHFLVAGVDASRRQVERAAANGVRDVAQRETQRPQPLERDLDRDLVVAYSGGLHIGDFGQRGERILGTVGEFLQRPLGHIPEEDEADDTLLVGNLGDFRALGAGGEGLDPVDLCLDVVEEPVQVLAQLQFGHDGPAALRRRGSDLLEPFDALDLLLDLEDDRFLDLIRSGAGIGDRDADPVQRDLGKDLLHQRRQREEPGQENEEHQEVGRDTVSRHVGDRSSRLPRAQAVVPIHGRRPIRVHNMLAQSAAHSAAALTAYSPSEPACPRSRSGFPSR